MQEKPSEPEVIRSDQIRSDQIRSLEDLQVRLLQLARSDQSPGTGAESLLDFDSILTSDIQLGDEIGQLISIDVTQDLVNIVEDLVDLLGARLGTVGKVVDVLDTALDDTLVLLDGILSRLLGLLALLLLGFGALLILLPLALRLLRSLGFLLGLALRSRLLFQPLLVLVCIRCLAELLDPLVHAETVVDEFPQTCDILGLTLSTGVGVFLLNVSFVVATLVVVRDVFVEVFERAPRVEVIPEVVELFDILFRAVVVTDDRDGGFLAEASFTLEDCIPFLIECAGLGDFFLCGRCDVGFFIDRVKLSALHRVGEDFMGALDAFEEGVVFVGLAGGGFLVRVVLQNLLAVGLLDLLVCGFVSVFR